MRTAEGLSSERAAQLLKQAGPNQPEMTHFFALMLWAAAGLAFIADMPQLAVAIVVVVIVNGVFAHIQQERAQHAAARLRGLLPADVLVRRDGKLRKVHASELVVDDVVLLSSGDRVPADMVLLSASACEVDESMLTGESDPVPKVAAEPAWGGTFLVNGYAEAAVSATGAGTRLAGIAALTSGAVPPPTPLSLELRRIVRVTAGMAMGIAAVFFLPSLLVGFHRRDSFLFSIGVAVALVPGGLLPTVTLSLAMGAQRMAFRGGLVRNLEAVETLGSTTFICTDKTGTLTQNRMNAVEVFTSEGSLQVTGEGYAPDALIEGRGVEKAAQAALAARTASQGRAELHHGQWRAQGDPMEAALDVLARRLTGTEAGPAPSRRLPFDPVRRRESAIVGPHLFCKGAPRNRSKRAWNSWA